MPDPQTPDAGPENADVSKLYALLNDAQAEQKVGHQILRAVIIDVLRSKAGGTDLIWFRRIFGGGGGGGSGGGSCVVAVLQELVDDVSLTDEEREILKTLEKEQEQGYSLSGGKKPQRRKT